MVAEIELNEGTTFQFEPVFQSPVGLRVELTLRELAQEALDRPISLTAIGSQCETSKQEVYYVYEQLEERGVKLPPKVSSGQTPEKYLRRQAVCQVWQSDTSPPSCSFLTERFGIKVKALRALETRLRKAGGQWQIGYRQRRRQGEELEQRDVPRRRRTPEEMAELDSQVAELMSQALQQRQITETLQTSQPEVTYYDVGNALKRIRARRTEEAARPVELTKTPRWLNRLFGWRSWPLSRKTNDR